MDDDWRPYSYAEVRAWPMDDRRYYVYRMWDADLECLYVGSTNWLRKRINGHRARATWPLFLIWVIDVCEFPSKDGALAAERYWHDRLSPPFNVLRPRITPQECRELHGSALHCGHSHHS